MNVQAGTSSQFSYIHFYYGGYGTGGFYAYAVLTVANLGTQVSIDHSVFEHNEYSGLYIGNSVVSVTSSTFKYNGDGISQSTYQSPEQLILTDSIVSHNTQDGLYFNVADNLSTPGSSVNNNLITANGSHGIEMLLSCSTPTTSFPHGNQNDIYSNGNTSNPSDGSELYTGYSCHAISVYWTGNYWGAATFYTGPTALEDGTACDGEALFSFVSDALTQPNGYLGYSNWVDQKKPPPGPISTDYYQTIVTIGCPGGGLENITTDNVYNSFYLQPGQISTSYIPIP